MPESYVKHASPSTPPHYFPVEAAGLRWLAAAPDGAAVVGVQAVDATRIVLDRLDPVRPMPEAAESFELPGADLSHEELTVRVLPQQSDEFTCAGCFLVRHRSQIAEQRANGNAYCYDCAG